MKNILKKYYKLIVLCLVVLIIIILSLFIYKNLFQQGQNNRLEGVENHQLTKKEKSELKENISFKDVKEKSNEVIEQISEKNLSFYDVEIFIECLDEDNEEYPKIGYKYKTSAEFTWNR